MQLTLPTNSNVTIPQTKTHHKTYTLVENGKISISARKKKCRHCEKMNDQVCSLRSELNKVRTQLHQYQQQHQQLDNLCFEIKQTKEKIMGKLIEKDKKITTRTVVKKQATSLKKKRKKSDICDVSTEKKQNEPKDNEFLLQNLSLFS